MTRNGLRSGIELNNYACWLIQNGKFEEAVSSLFTALQATKASAQGDNCLPENETKEYASSDSRLRSGCSMESVLENACDDCNIAIDSSVTSRSFMYRKPVRIREDYCQDSYLQYVSFAIIFNLALSHHLNDIDNREQKQTQQPPFQTAKRLYELAFQLQAQMNERNLILTSALLNNLSLVHQRLDSTLEAEQCQKLLLSIILLLVDHGEASTEFSVELDGFLGNVLHLILNASPVARAA